MTLTKDTALPNRHAETLLSVTNLKTYFFTDDGVVKSVDGVTFHLGKGETLAVVGESGSGKSVTSLSAMRLIPTPPGKIVEGEMLFTGKDGKTGDLAKMSEAEMRKIRGNDISMIFQEPMTSLNPVYTVGDQIAEAVHSTKAKTARKPCWSPPRCCGWWASRPPRSAFTSTPTRCPAACASA